VEAEVPGQVEQRAIVDDQAIDILPEHGGFHAIVEDLPGRAAEGLKRCDVAAQHGSEVLVQNEASPDQPRVAEHQGEQPDDALGPGFVGERDLEAGEVDLALNARWRLKADLEWLDRIGAQLLDRPLDPGVAAGEALLAQLAAETDGGQPGVGRQPITQIGQERIRDPRSRCPRAVSGRLEAEGDVSAHRLAVDPQLAADGREAQPLSMQFHDHDQLPNSNHRIRPQQTEATWMDTQRSGEFSTPTSGEHSPTG